MSADLRGMYVAVAAATAAIAAAATASHLNTTMEQQILMRETEMHNLITQMSEESRKYLNEVAAGIFNRNIHVDGILTQKFGDFQRSVLDRLNAFIATQSVSGDEIKRVVHDVLRTEMTTANATLEEHMHALDLAAAGHTHALRETLTNLAGGIYNHNKHFQDEFMQRFKLANVTASHEVGEAGVNAINLQARNINKTLSENSIHLQRLFAKRLDQMTAETRSEIKSVIESAVANQSKLLEERLRETLSRIEAEQREAISTERSNKKRRNSETGDYGLKMQDALDSLKATTTQIIETKSEEVARALGETQKATAALEISVKELRSSNKELVRSENLSREATNGLHANVVKLNQTMNQVSISHLQDFIRKTGIEAARRSQGGSSS